MNTRELLQRLAPHRPLDAQDDRYVPRPEGGGERLARIAAVDTRPIVVAGPAGAGKSTELARAAAALADEAVACLVALDKRLDLSAASPESVYRVCARELRTYARDTLGVEPESAMASLAHALSGSVQKLPQRPADDDLREAIRHIARKSAHQKVVLLVDGLEKCGEEVGRRVVEGLTRFANEAGLVIAVPPPLVTGPRAYAVLQGFRLFPVGPVPPSVAGSFLMDVLTRRVPRNELPTGFVFCLEDAVRLSGGLPRAFLSLLHDTVLYASLADRSEPTPDDFRDAVRDQAESMRRLLEADDDERLKTRPEKLDAASRARLLSHGLLLEFRVDGHAEWMRNPLLDAA